MNTYVIIPMYNNKYMNLKMYFPISKNRLLEGNTEPLLNLVSPIVL